MNNFSITTRLTTKDYIKVMYVGLYRNPGFILATLLGLYFLTTAILELLSIIDGYTDTPLFQIAWGAFLLIAPTLIVLIAVRQFKSNRSFQHDITYSFNENGFASQGLTFKSEFLWTHIIKYKEIGNFLILYHSKKIGNFIDKTKLTAEQLNFIKSKVRK